MTAIGQTGANFASSFYSLMAPSWADSAAPTAVPSPKPFLGARLRPSSSQGRQTLLSCASLQSPSRGVTAA